MERAISLVEFKSNIKTYSIDFLLMLFIYLAPAISHLFAFPIYYLDPMRIALVVTLIYTTKKNSFLIALTLPLFSFFISSHPQIMKAFLLSAELLINLSLFFLLEKKIKNLFTAFLLSVIVSKIIYYIIKLSFINFGLIDDKLFSTPIYFQAGSAVVLSFLLLWRLNSNTNGTDVKKL